MNTEKFVVMTTIKQQNELNQSNNQNIIMVNTRINEQNNRINEQNNKDNNKSTQPDQFIVDKQFIEQCRLHVRANRIAKDCINPKTCKCCYKSYKNERLSLFCSLKELGFLGPGIPLYFQFLKIAGNILLISLIFSAFMIYTNETEGTYCVTQANNVNIVNPTNNKQDCYKDIYSKFSLVNVKNKNDIVNQYTQIHFGMSLVLFFALHIFLRIMNTLYKEVKQAIHSPENYTAQIFNMPQGYKDKQKYPEQMNNHQQPQQQKIFNQQFINNQFQTQINYPLYQQQQQQQPNELQQQQQSSDKYLSQNYCNYNLPDKIGYNNNEIAQAFKDHYPNLNIEQISIAYDMTEFNKGDDKIKQYILKGENRRQYCTSSCFVTFSTQKQLNIFLKNQSRNTFQNIWIQFILLFGSTSKSYFLFRGRLLHAQKAPAPDDVYWENISEGNNHPIKKKFYRLLTILVNLGLIGITVVCLFFVNDYKRRIASSKDFKDIGNNSLALTGLACVNGGIVFTINIISKQVVSILSSWEYRSTKTHLNISKGNKLFLLQLCNSTAVYIILYLIKYENTMWLAGGLLSDVLITHLQIAILNPFINIIMNFLKYLQRYCLPYGKTAEKNSNEQKLLFNKIVQRLQGYEFNIAQQYANTLFLLFSVSFYGPLMPILYIVGWIALFLQYWTDKYHLLKRYRSTSSVSGDINQNLLFIIQYIPLVQIISFAFWLYILKFDKKVFSYDYIYYGIAVALITIIIPKKFISMIFCKNSEVKTQEELSYNDALVRGHFKTFYDLCNPISKHESIKKYNQIQQYQSFSKELIKFINESLLYECPINNSNDNNNSNNGAGQNQDQIIKDIVLDKLKQKLSKYYGSNNGIQFQQGQELLQQQQQQQPQQQQQQIQQQYKQQLGIITKNTNQRNSNLYINNEQRNSNPFINNPYLNNYQRNNSLIYNQQSQQQRNNSQINISIESRNSEQNEYDNQYSNKKWNILSDNMNNSQNISHNNYKNNKRNLAQNKNIDIELHRISEINDSQKDKIKNKGNNHKQNIQVNSNNQMNESENSNNTDEEDDDDDIDENIEKKNDDQDDNFQDQKNKEIQHSKISNEKFIMPIQYISQFCEHKQ